MSHQKLRTLYLYGNQLTRKIPIPPRGTGASLELLGLSFNRLTGGIPQLGNLINLKGLWLRDNELRGPVPAGLSSLANLETISLRGNDLIGCVPDALDSWFQGLTQHDLGVDANGDCDWDDPGDTSGLNLPFESSPCCVLLWCEREPFPPESVRITGDGNTSLTVNWDPPLYDGRRMVTGYKVQWIAADQGSFRNGEESSVLNAEVRQYTIMGLMQGTWYMVQVLAVNPRGDSPGSNSAWGVPGAGPGQYGSTE